MHPDYSHQYVLWRDLNMKVRFGFVSNSSSTCFLLDMRNHQTENIVNSLKLRKPFSLCRNTCKCVGKDAIKYAKSWRKEIGEDYETEGIVLDEAILKCAKEIGENNIAFIRVSDEDDEPISEETMKILFDNSVESFEYH